MSFQWFLRLLCQMTNKIYEDRSTGSIKDSQYMETHVFVTGNKNTTPGTVILNSDDIYEPEITDLATMMLNTGTSSQLFSQIMLNTTSAPNKYGDIFMWNGRPDWY